MICVSNDIMEQIDYVRKNEKMHHYTYGDILKNACLWCALYFFPFFYTILDTAVSSYGKSAKNILKFQAVCSLSTAVEIGIFPWSFLYIWWWITCSYCATVSVVVCCSNIRAMPLKKRIKFSGRQQSIKFDQRCFEKNRSFTCSDPFEILKRSINFE